MTSEVLRLGGMDKKKTYKEENGVTRVGNFLSNLDKPETLKKILGVAGGVVTGNYGSIIDIITGSTELTEIEKEMAILELQADVSEYQEITKRWQSDMVSDSWLSKNIRPLVLGYLVLSMTIVMVLDSSGVLEVAEHWVTLLTSLLLTVIAGYYGARTYEKIKGKN